MELGDGCGVVHLLRSDLIAELRPGVECAWLAGVGAGVKVLAPEGTNGTGLVHRPDRNIITASTY